MRTTGSSLARDAGDEGLLDERSSPSSTADAADRKRRSATSSTSERVTPAQHALLLRAQRAVSDREEVAREPLEQRAVVGDEQAFLDPSGSRA